MVASTLLTVVAPTTRPVPVGRTTKVVVASIHRMVAALTSTLQPLAQTTKVVLVTPTSLVAAPMVLVGLLVPTRKVSTYTYIHSTISILHCLQFIKSPKHTLLLSLQMLFGK